MNGDEGKDLEHIARVTLLQPYILGWEFIKEKKEERKQENTHLSKKKRTRSRKHALDPESVHEKKTSSRKNGKKNMISTKKTKNDSGKENTISTKKTIKKINF